MQCGGRWERPMEDSVKETPVVTVKKEKTEDFTVVEDPKMQMVKDTYEIYRRTCSKFQSIQQMMYQAGNEEEVRLICKLSEELNAKFPEDP